ncbi:cell division protein DivIVA [Rothia sp. P6271]|uniref:cell division protein DivIVA n=1 Tax=unclassified Rothia (in: high G+C Gram-positive bacteria) TaxID=2689056 RepID=UPI003AC755A4
MGERRQRVREFRAVEPKKQGYSAREVDAFFVQLVEDFENLRAGQTYPGMMTSTTIRTMSFTPVQGGYYPADVDATLDRVEDRFASLERRRYIEKYGRQTWRQAVEESAELVMGRINRASGERFRRPSSARVQGYFVDDVDALCEKLRQHFRGEGELSAGLVRRAVFRSAVGSLCYEETQVDAFMDRCIELILDLK